MTMCHGSNSFNLSLDSSHLIIFKVIHSFIHLHSSIHTGTCALDMEFVNKLD